jgi:hypothetical protein
MIYLAEFFLEWETSQTKVVEKIKTHIVWSVISYQKSYRTVYRGGIAIVLYVLDILG